MNSITPTSLNKSNQFKFTGSAQIVKKEMYAVTDIFSQMMQKMTQDRFLQPYAKYQGSGKPQSPLIKEPFLEILAKLLRRSAQEIKTVFDIKDEAKINQEFFQLRESFNQTQRNYEKALDVPIEGKELTFHLQRIFKNDLEGFLKKNNFINDEYVFAKLPAKLAVLKKGTSSVDDNLAKLADKVVINQGVELYYPLGKKLVIRNLKDKNAQIVADKVDIKNSTFGSIVSTGDIYSQKNIKGLRMESMQESVNLLGEGNSIQEIKAKKDINANIKNAKFIKSSDSYVVLLGESNRVEHINAMDFVLARNLTAKKVESVNSYIQLSGSKNVVDDVRAHHHVEARNLVAQSVESSEREVELVGGSNMVNRLRAKGNVAASNLTAESVHSKAGSLMLSGEKNEVRVFVKAQDNICVENLKTPRLESVAGGVQVHGKDNSIDCIKAKTYVSAQNLQSTHIETALGNVKGKVNGCKIS